MPRYIYTALTLLSGEEITGTIDAIDEAEACASLLDRGLYPKKLDLEIDLNLKPTRLDFGWYARDTSDTKTILIIALVATVVVESVVLVWMWLQLSGSSH